MQHVQANVHAVLRVSVRKCGYAGGRSDYRFGHVGGSGLDWRGVS